MGRLRYFCWRAASRVIDRISARRQQCRTLSRAHAQWPPSPPRLGVGPLGNVQAPMESYRGVLGHPTALARHHSLFASSDTIFALSSGHGKCGVAVIRLSGPQAREAMLKIGNLDSEPTPRRATFRKLLEPKTGDTIDHGLLLWFPGPHSFTGEDSVEFQVHGGLSVVAALLTALAGLSGCRHADPGEFTQRAFFNGKLDLTEVEGLADLIHAETEAQRKQALRQMEGDLGRLYERWSRDLLRSVAHLEAFIDFGEEENIEDNVLGQLVSDVEVLHREILRHLSDGRRGERLRSGVHVAIVGAPNAGKSSLLNLLCQRPAAIVSPYPGTTRDVLESALDICGYPVVLSDTAGLRAAEDPVEVEGVKRAVRRSESADLKILIADCTTLKEHLTQDLDNSTLLELTRRLLVIDPAANSDGGWMEEAVQVFDPENTILVLNKTDLMPEEMVGGRLGKANQGISVCWVSCKTNNGIQYFMEVLREHLEKLCGNPLAGSPSLTQARHREHLSHCAVYISNFLGFVSESSELSLDLAAEELRSAIRQLGRITGKVSVEDILDVVFRDFCIGK